MRRSIRTRLLLYFTAVLLIFSVIIGSVFSLLFYRYNLDMHRQNMEERAAEMAAALSPVISQDSSTGNGHGMGHMMGSRMQPYMRFLDAFGETDYWLIGSDRRQILRGHGQSELSFSEMPPDSARVIAEALAGTGSISTSFGTYLGTPSITASAPVRSADGGIIAAILLHDEISNIQGAAARGLLILFISMILSVILSFFISRLLAGHFTNPLQKMQAAAQRISSGNYETRTGVEQEDEIGKLAAALDSMAGQLQLASRERSLQEQRRRDFTANISHELRTPVTVIRGSLEAIRDGVVSGGDKLAEYHSQMLTESIYLERLVTDLLDLAKLQNLDFTLSMSPLDLKELAADVLRSIGRIARPRAIELNLSVRGSRFLTFGDYGRLRQMLLIVLNNAVKFSPDASEIAVELEQEANGIRISVQDSGVGIPADELPFIFERFRKQRSEQNKEGTGLGLAIAREIALRHGIRIDVKSEPGRGSRFDFWFPALAAEEHRV